METSEADWEIGVAREQDKSVSQRFWPTAGEAAMVVMLNSWRTDGGLIPETIRSCDYRILPILRIASLDANSVKEAAFPYITSAQVTRGILLLWWNKIRLSLYGYTLCDYSSQLPRKFRSAFIVISSFFRKNSARVTLLQLV